MQQRLPDKRLIRVPFVAEVSLELFVIESSSDVPNCGTDRVLIKSSPEIDFVILCVQNAESRCERSELPATLGSPR